MAKKITLVPEPTFEANVPIPTAGAGLVDCRFTFKYRTQAEMETFLSKYRPDSPDYRPDMPNHELVMECASGWELADTFNAENVKVFCQKYIAGPAAVFETYCAELSGARAKNSVRPRY